MTFYKIKRKHIYKNRIAFEIIHKDCTYTISTNTCLPYQFICDTTNKQFTPLFDSRNDEIIGFTD